MSEGKGFFGELSDMIDEVLPQDTEPTPATKVVGGVKSILMAHQEALELMTGVAKDASSARADSVEQTIGTIEKGLKKAIELLAASRRTLSILDGE